MISEASEFDTCFKLLHRPVVGEVLVSHGVVLVVCTQNNVTNRFSNRFGNYCPHAFTYGDGGVGFRLDPPSQAPPAHTDGEQPTCLPAAARKYFSDSVDWGTEFSSLIVNSPRMLRFECTVQM